MTKAGTRCFIPAPHLYRCCIMKHSGRGRTDDEWVMVSIKVCPLRRLHILLALFLGYSLTLSFGISKAQSMWCLEGATTPDER